jgi:hypothetical protein
MKRTLLGSARSQSLQLHKSSRTIAARTIKDAVEDASIYEKALTACDKAGVDLGSGGAQSIAQGKQCINHTASRYGAPSMDVTVKDSKCSQIRHARSESGMRRFGEVATACTTLEHSESPVHENALNDRPAGFIGTIVANSSVVRSQRHKKLQRFQELCITLLTTLSRSQSERCIAFFKSLRVMKSTQSGRNDASTVGNWKRAENEEEAKQETSGFVDPALQGA